MEDNFKGTPHSYTQQSSQPLPRRRTSQHIFAWIVAVGTTPRHLLLWPKHGLNMSIAKTQLSGNTHIFSTRLLFNDKGSPQPLEDSLMLELVLKLNI
jgi:hypothetical protein